MPHTNRDQTMYVPTGNPDTWTQQTLTRPGELGKAYDYNDRSYQRVQLDSGATVSNTVGVVAANQLAFWKDRATYLVTNDKRFSEYAATANAAGNDVAGVFRSAVTAGYYCDILQRGRNIAAAAVSGVTQGETVIWDATANTASIDSVAVGTATTYQKLGVVRTSVSASVAYVDFDIPNIP